MALCKEGNVMRKLSMVAVVVAGLAVVASPAFADDKKPPPADKGGGNGGGGNGRVKVYDFSGDTIEGDLIKPEGSTVDARDFAKHGSLIKIRTNFIPEIIKSAEDLP
jgi:hypothetical protein